MATGKLKRHTSPGSDQIPVEMFTTEGWTICYEVHKLINSIWNKEELPNQWKESITVPIYKGDNAHSSNYHNTITFFNYILNSTQHPSVQVLQRKLLGITRVGSNETSHH
jgi:hypothetical protein